MFASRFDLIFNIAELLIIPMLMYYVLFIAHFVNFYAVISINLHLILPVLYVLVSFFYSLLYI